MCNSRSRGGYSIQSIKSSQFVIPEFQLFLFTTSVANRHAARLMLNSSRSFELRLIFFAMLALAFAVPAPAPVPPPLIYNAPLAYPSPYVQANPVIYNPAAPYPGLYPAAPIAYAKYF
ncbi:uncharacterized protein isoform X1 [Choristoneura fumiferana]|uniref:uncharacterized protein isoform X1 n=1 Tax=Choristoneura fumiferana TaxID=7141 RepID=UPI003D155E07